jgi:hypothetical protein
VTQPGGATPDGGLMAVVLRLTELASQVERVEQSTDRRLAELAESCAKARTEVTTAHEEAGSLGDRAGRIEQSIAEIGTLLAQMSTRIEELARDSESVKGKARAPYQVNPVPPWWQPDHEQCGETVARLRDWVEEVFRPGFGHVGAKLAGCWEQHPVCVAYLDTLHEAWCLLYIPPRDARTVFAQLDWLTRSLLQAAEVLAKETRHCSVEHRDPRHDFIGALPAWPNGRR